VGPYRILEKIGEGGMGVVYLGELTRPVRRRVAIKVLKDSTGSDEVVARFEAERQALALMSHPFVARIVYADVTEGGQPYFVMDHVPGLPITEFCDSRRLDIEARIGLFLQVCSAVRHAHQRGIIHRDLKPSNILVTEESGVATPRIIDFGVAKATHVRLTDRTLHTRVGQVVGTPEYMSPEQADGSMPEVDTRTDVYALGVVLFELLSGGRPHDFSGKRISLREVQRVLREVQPPPPSAAVLLAEEGDAPGDRGTTAPVLASSLRGDLDAIVSKAIAKDAGRRYASVDRFVDDLQRYLDRRPVLARPDSFAYRASRFVRRNRPSVVAAALVALSLVGGLVATTSQARRAGAEAQIAQVARDRAQQQLQVSREISRFIVSQFRINQASEDLELRRAMLRRAVAEAEAYTGGPEVQSLIFTTLSEAHTLMSLYDEAERLAERALEIIRAVEPQGSAVEAQALMALGMAFYSPQVHEKSRAAWTRAYTLATRYMDPDDPVRSQVASFAGTSALVLGQQAVAERYFRESVDILRAADPDHAELPARLALIAQAQIRASQYRQAEETLLEVIELSQRVLGPRHPESIRASLILADMLHEKRREIDRPEGLYRSALSDLEEVIGPSDVRLIFPLNGLAFLLAAKGQVEEAESLIQRSVRISEAARGADNLATVRQREQMARVYILGGRAREAYPIVDEAVRGKLELGAHIPAAVTLSLYGREAVAHGHLDQAEAYAEWLTEIADRLGADSPYSITAHVLHAEIHRARAMPERAEAEWRTALAEAEQQADLPVFVRNQLRGLVTLYEGWGRHDDAESARLRLARLAERSS